MLREIDNVIANKQSQITEQDVSRDAANETTGQRRKKLWQIHSGYHCSVIGACLSRRDLRQIAGKKNFSLDPGLNSFAIHRVLSTIASERVPRTRALSKLLDSKYRNAIKRYSMLSSDDEVRKEWKKDLKAERAISGAFWAIMTLPNCGKDLLDEVYGDCHMKSYDIFSSFKNKAQATVQLKKQNHSLKDTLDSTKALHAKELEALQWELSELQKSKAEYLRKRLINEHLVKENRELKRKLESVGQNQNINALEREIEDLRTQNRELLAAVETASEKKDQRMEILSQQIADMKVENGQLQEELLSLEGMFQLGMSSKTVCDTCEEKHLTGCQGVGLSGKVVLYVGGRSNMIAHYREMVEKYDGIFLHHDGGKESSRTLLPKMLSGADAVLCPIDCVSHDACKCVKKICKRNCKPFVMMRSSGLSSLAKGLETIIQ